MNTNIFADHLVEIPQVIALRLQLALIAGDDRAGYIERRVERDGLYEPAFLPTVEAVEGARELWPLLSECRDNVFVGVCPRARKPGSGVNGCGKDADVVRAWTLWADCDTPEAIENLERFEYQPSLVVSSGAGVHAYWQLDRPAPAEKVRQANRRLAYRLGSDPVATNPSRILRMVGSWNVKRRKTVIATHLEPVAYDPGELVDHLPDHPADQPRPEKRHVSFLPGVSTETRLAGPLRRLRAAIEGERNNILFWAARCALEGGVDEGEARVLLREAALDAGLEEREITGTLASAWRAVA